MEDRGQALLERGSVAQHVVGQVAQQPFVLQAAVPGTPAVADDGRHSGQAAEDAPPDIGHHGERHEQVRGVGPQGPPQGEQIARADGTAPAEPAHGQAIGRGLGQEVLAADQGPQGHVEAFGGEPGPEFQGLALGSAEKKVLQQQDDLDALHGSLCRSWFSGRSDARRPTGGAHGHPGVWPRYRARACTFPSDMGRSPGRGLGSV
jgi:hypothetical protein